jgi:uncharacterized repeat protein (TIGR01451 family)
MQISPESRARVRRSLFVALPAAFLVHVLGWPGQPAAFAASPSADLALAMSAPPNAVTGSTISFILTLTNLGPNDAVSVTVTDNLPPELAFRSCSATGGGACSGAGNARTIVFPGLASGATATITLDADVPCSTPPGTIIVNTAGVVAASPVDPDTSNNTASATVTILFVPPPPPPPVVIVAPEIVGAFSPNRIASVLYPFGSVFTWTIANGTITSGQGTPRITFTAGIPGVLDLGVTESNPPSCYSFQGSAIVTVAPVGEAVQYYTLAPCRLVDTRGADGPLGGPALEASGGPDRSFALTGTCGIPPEATSVSVNVTVLSEPGGGTLSIYRGDGALSGTTTISFAAGKTRANNAVLQLATDGSGTIKVNNTAPGPVHFILDVNGYFE